MEEIAEKAKRIIADTLGVEKSKLTPETNLCKDLGTDSLDVVELVMILEKEFHISIPDERAERMSRVGDFIDYLETVNTAPVNHLHSLEAAHIQK